MKIKKLVSLFLVLMLIFSIVSACSSPSTNGNSSGEEPNNNTDNTSNPERKNVYTWGSSSLGSQGYIIIEALASTANKHLDFRNTSISTAGGAENMVLLDQGEIDFGQATSSDLFNAYNGENPFDKKIDFTQVFAYGFWSLPILVLDDSGINTIEDLKGKRISVGTAGGASAVIINTVLEEYGIADQVKYDYLNPNESARALGQGQVDAIALWHMAGNLASSSLQELALTHNFRPVPFDADILERVSQKNEGVQSTITLKSAFDFYPEDTLSPGISGMLVTSFDQDEETVYQLVKALYENSEEAQQIGPELAYFTLDYAVEGLVPSYPVHPGAARYFMETGVWDENLLISE